MISVGRALIWQIFGNDERVPVATAPESISPDAQALGQPRNNEIFGAVK